MLPDATEQRGPLRTALAHAGIILAVAAAGAALFLLVGIYVVIAWFRGA